MGWEFLGGHLLRYTPRIWWDSLLRYTRCSVAWFCPLSSGSEWQHLLDQKLPLIWWNYLVQAKHLLSRKIWAARHQNKFLWDASMKFQQGPKFVLHPIFITKETLLNSGFEPAAAVVWIHLQEELFRKFCSHCSCWSCMTYKNTSVTLLEHNFWPYRAAHTNTFYPMVLVNNIQIHQSNTWKPWNIIAFRDIEMHGWFSGRILACHTGGQDLEIFEETLYNLSTSDFLVSHFIK